MEKDIQKLQQDIKSQKQMCETLISATLNMLTKQVGLGVCWIDITPVWKPNQITPCDYVVKIEFENPFNEEN